MELSKYSIGVGDRFAHQAAAQLEACRAAKRAGVEVVPVWNKSNREHLIVGSEPPSVRAAAARAVESLGWDAPWHIDADHITLATVGRFVTSSDFFTIDVADAIGKPAPQASVDSFLRRHPELSIAVQIKGLLEPIAMNGGLLQKALAKYLFAVEEAARTYRFIEGAKGAGNFITEVSMDETDLPQSPAELLVILAALADAGVPLQTIAPKFSGRFNKGVDYAGNIEQFKSEFSADVAVIAHAVTAYGLPKTLKLSVHSGSDKFSLYPIMAGIIRRYGAGLHLKTAGTTWLEELIGLAESGEEALQMAKCIYAEALSRREELCAPYASVVDIDPSRLPSQTEVAGWTASEFAAALRHDQSCAAYNMHLRQLLHVGYKVAAEMKIDYLSLLRDCEKEIARNVTQNLYERHIAPLFCSTPK